MAAYRELSIAAELAQISSPHIVPVLDAGQDSESDRYYVVMPLAEGTLQDEVSKRGPFSEMEAAAKLGAIAAGLAAVPQIVHRDLKPANVLRLDARWQIADFGIARFVEASTSLDTLKECLTPPFAAPEQWSGERCTGAADVYALGCVGYVLLTGLPPFTGSADELREQHLHTAPPPCDRASPAMRMLLSAVLRKPPSARMSLKRVREVLAGIEAGPPKLPRPTSLVALAGAAATHAAKQAETEAQRAKAEADGRARVLLAREARRILVDVYQELADSITSAIPSAFATEATDAVVTLTIQVAGATLTLELPRLGDSIAHDAFPRSGWDVVCSGTIEVRAPKKSRRSSSLWYKRQDGEVGEWRWTEVAYRGLTEAAMQRLGPLPSAADISLADQAHATGMGAVYACDDPVPIDDEQSAFFCARWLYILEAAVADRLSSLPDSLPAPPDLDPG